MHQDPLSSFIVGNQFVNLNEKLSNDYNHSYMKILTDFRSRLTSEIEEH